ncbi:MAG: 50S ribosomal protein L37ae [Candidatus Diapherotrites archaeon]|nr:50S ribosomal protein L37ae [Candidatus Diapherotrites archaeon]
MGDTKKVKHAGRFGSRYGKGIRDRVLEIEVKQRTLHKCPSCGSKALKRVSTGIYRCKRCGIEVAGGAYTPSTMAGSIVKKMVKQRKFLPLLKELLESTEGEAAETKPEEEKEEAKKESIAEKVEE